MNDTDRILSVKLLARRWGLSPRTLDRWRRIGRGPCYAKLGGRVTYQLSDIHAYEASRRQAPVRAGEAR